MMMIDPAKLQLLAIVENQHFNDLFVTMKYDIAVKMMETNEVNDLVRLREEVRALDRLQGKLTEIANEVRMTR